MTYYHIKQKIKNHILRDYITTGLTNPETKICLFFKTFLLIPLIHFLKCRGAFL